MRVRFGVFTPTGALTVGLTFQATEIESAALVLTCGDWQVKLSQGVLRHEQTLPTVYLATVAKQDSSTFTLGEDALDNGIVGALFQFLSFQAGRWIEIPTIICHPPTTGNPLVERACLRKLASDEDKPREGWTSSHWPDWPSQFNHFWKKYTDAKTHNHLRHAVQHYVDCDRIFNGRRSQLLHCGVPVHPRGLAGKPLAGFCTTPSRRITVVYGVIVYAIRFRTPSLHR